MCEKSTSGAQKSTQFPGRGLQPVGSCPVGAGNQNLGALQKQPVLLQQRALSPAPDHICLFLCACGDSHHCTRTEAKGQLVSSLPSTT